MKLLDIIVLAVQALSLVGILTTIAILFDRKNHYEQEQKKHSTHIEKEIVNQELKAFKQKIQELKTLVDKQQLGTSALVKDSEEHLEKKPEHQIKHSEQSVKKTRGRKTIPVLVLDKVTDEEKVYDSIEAFGTEKGLNVSACRSAKNKGHLLNKRYFIE